MGDVSLCHMYEHAHGRQSINCGCAKQHEQYQSMIRYRTNIVVFRAAGGGCGHERIQTEKLHVQLSELLRTAGTAMVSGCERN